MIERIRDSIRRTVVPIVVSAALLALLLAGCAPVATPRALRPLATFTPINRGFLIPNSVPVYLTPTPTFTPVPEEVLYGIGLATGHDLPAGNLTAAGIEFAVYGSWAAVDVSDRDLLGRWVRVIVRDPETKEELKVRVFQIADTGYLERAGRFRWNGWMFVPGEEYGVILDFPWETFEQLGNGKTLIVEVWLL